MEEAAVQTSYWTLLIYTLAVLGLAGGMLGLSFLLGQYHQNKYTNTPYESGINPTGSSRIRFSAHFYLIAMFFVIFDLEVVFILSWAIAFRETGWVGLGGVTFFAVILLASEAYLWRSKALDWGPNPLRHRKAPIIPK